MARGLVFSLIVWALVSIGIMVFSHLNNSEKVSVVRALIYGGICAAIAAMLVVGMVVLF